MGNYEIEGDGSLRGRRNRARALTAQAPGCAGRFRDASVMMGETRLFERPGESLPRSSHSAGG